MVRLPAACALPHRQLRNLKILYIISIVNRALPHRQLRNAKNLSRPQREGALPHRQLRNLVNPSRRLKAACAAAQAA